MDTEQRWINLRSQESKRRERTSTLRQPNQKTKQKNQTLSKIRKFKNKMKGVSYISELVTTQSIRGGLCARFNKHIHAIKRLIHNYLGKILSTNTLTIMKS
jgi:hypothetical protein